MRGLRRWTALRDVDRRLGCALGDCQEDWNADDRRGRGGGVCLRRNNVCFSRVQGERPDCDEMDAGLPAGVGNEGCRRRREVVYAGGVYQSIPGVSNQTFIGRKAIHKYWFDVTRPQSVIHGIQGKPIVTGDRAAIEIWVTFRDPVYNPKGKHMITLLETNVVTFVKGGLASKNVEYWNIIPGVHAPPPGWGT
jgi:hypothetical protein